MTDNFQTVFISGANRGIGLELAQQLSKQSYKVIAGYRDKTRSQVLLDEAQRTKNLFSFQVDVTLESDLDALHNFISTQFGILDILINNAGVNLNRSSVLNELRWSDFAHHLDINVGGAFLTTKHLYPLLKTGQSKKIINISSKLASIELSGGHSIPYSLSKTALNMLTKNQSVEYKSDGVAVISLSPGWVRTDMGGEAAPLSVQESAKRILQVINTLSLAQTGQFLDLNGDILPY